jgi:hypothetical protein
MEGSFLRMLSGAVTIRHGIESASMTAKISRVEA